MTRNKRRGFTLVEMMVVIVIIGILATVLITQISGRADKAKYDATKATIAQVANALDMFKLDHNRYPERLDELVQPPPWVDQKKWPVGGYLRQYARDGWDREFLYRVPGTNGLPYDIVSLGEDGREGGLGYAEDLSNAPVKKQ